MWGKPFIVRVENEFKTSNMRDKHVFHDINLRVSDPEEFRVTVVDYLRSLDYIVDVNEMIEFDDDGDFAKFFRGGRLKPLKNIVKARKVSVLGSRFPVIWRLLFLVGVVSFIGLFLPFEQLNDDLLFYVSSLSFFFAGLFFIVKRVVTSSVWVKMIGVYDVDGVKADLRVIISADVSDSDLRVFDKLRDDVAEFYGLISRKYLLNVKLKEALIKPVTKSKTEELVSRIMKVNKDSRLLQDKFINGRVSEDVFKRLMASLDKEKDKLETILDLVSV